jgi:hypothetical protein
MKGSKTELRIDVRSRVHTSYEYGRRAAAAADFIVCLEPALEPPA